MKNYIKICVIIIAIVFAGLFEAEAQNNNGQGQGKGKNKIENANQKKGKGKHINGRKHRNCCDTTNAKCTNFIDKDGDGINDNRCTGMGLGRQKRQGRKLSEIDTSSSPKK